MSKTMLIEAPDTSSALPEASEQQPQAQGRKSGPEGRAQQYTDSQTVRKARAGTTINIQCRAALAEQEKK